MQKGITALLKKEPWLKAKVIAKKLNLERSIVNKHLHDNKSIYHQSQASDWSLLDSFLKLSLYSKSAWISASHFERALKQAGSPHDSAHRNIIIKISDQSKVKLCAASRILAIANQMANIGKYISIDFTGSEDAVSYLNRAGFFDRLHSSVDVFPRRPSESSAKNFNNNSRKLVELHEIGVPGGENVPDRLKASFIDAVGHDHANVLFSAIGELVGNVEEHAAAKQPGFAGLQCYVESARRRLQIQTVVSDSGVGICGTLRPVLAKKYPELLADFDKQTTANDASLVVHAFTNGEISSVDEEGRGLGLKNSAHSMEVLNGKLNIRQENFSVTLKYRDGERTVQVDLDLPRILGTQIVSEIHLTNKLISA